MIMDFKILKRLLIVGIFIGIQGCASVDLNPFSKKPYFASPPADVTQADRELFDRALFRQTNNRIQPAIKVWNEFLLKHPRSFEAHNNLGLVYFEDDQVNASIAELEKAMSLEPNESKIKENLVRVLKFKSTLYKEAKDYNRAVDTLRRVQEISPPEKKEKIGFRIEEYEDKAFEQAKRINTLESYEGYLKRYPNSSKNSDEARMKIEGLKPRETAFSDEKMVSEEEVAPAPSESAPLEGEVAMLEGSLGDVENKKDMAQPPSTMKDMAEKKMESVTTEEPPVEEDSAVKALEKLDMAVKTPSADENMDRGFVPVQPLEVPRTGEQKIEIATQPEPKPATGANIFPVLDPEASPPETVVSAPEPDFSPPDHQVSASVMDDSKDDAPEVARVPKKKVRIVTRRDPLRVREDPTLDSQVLATIAKGSLVPFIKEENGWYKVEFSAGEMGWVSKKYSQLVE